jgi:peroxiredoxin Q/BCP
MWSLRLVAATLLALFALGACSRNDAAPSQKAAPANPAKAASTLLAEGARAPALTVKAHNGERLALGSLGKPSVVYFYPRDDTPGCTTEATEIRDLWSEIQQTGAIVIGVSTDGETSHQAFAEKYALPFLLVPDEDHAVAQAFGVPVANGKAARVSFVLGADGSVTKVFPKVTPKGHGAELVAALGSKPAR